MENRKIKKLNKFASLFFGLLILACAIFPNLSIWAVDEPDYTGFELQIYGFSSEIDNGDTATNNIHFDVNNTSWSGVYKLQINYSNQLTPQEYAPGEIQIRIDNPTKYLIPNGGSSDSNYSFTNLKISADPKNSTEKQYTFSYEYVYPTYNSETNSFEDGYILFTNNNTIEAERSFTGSIQITYPINYINTINNSGYDIFATLGELKSNTINISFNVAPKIYNMSVRNEEKIKGYSGLPENAEDYIWVKTRFYHYYSGVIPVNERLGQLCIPIEDENIIVVTNNTNYPATKIDVSVGRK